MKKHLFAFHVLMAAMAGAAGGGFASAGSRGKDTPPAGAPLGQIDTDPSTATVPDAALAAVMAADPAPAPVAPVATAGDAEFAPDAGNGTAHPGEVVDAAGYANAVVAGDIAPIPGTTGPSPFKRAEAPPATVLPVDDFHGLGGDYVIGEDGVRRPAAPSA